MPTRRNYASVYQDGRQRLQNNTPVNNFGPQSTTKGLLDTISLETERIYDLLEDLDVAKDPTQTTGLNLSRWGFLVGETRAGSKTASDYSDTNFYFYIDKKLNWTIKKLIEEFYTQEEIDVLDEQDLVTLEDGSVTALKIPAGTTITNANGSITYSTIEEAVLTGTDNAFVGVVANATGSDHNVQTNVLISHRIHNRPELGKISRYIKCSNRFPIQNGRARLTDEEYRYNIATAPNSFPGNELSVRRDSLSIPGVRDIMFERNKFGNGTVSIIVDGISPLISQGLINAINERLKSSSYEVFYVHAPQYLGVELNFNIEVEPRTEDPLTLRDLARRAVIQYINDRPIGGEIVWNQIVNEIIDIDGIKDFAPNYFKYGKYNASRKINTEQIVLRFLNQRAKYNERWYTDSGLVTCCVV